MASLVEILEAPSRRLVESCRKSVLEELAAHLGLHGTRAMLKQDLRKVVFQEMEKRGLLSPPAGGETDLSQVDECTEEAEQSNPPGTPPRDAPSKMSRTPEERKITPVPVTLPRYDPPSPTSPRNSLESARLRVRLAQLKSEAEEKEKARQQDAALEIKRLEIEAETKLRLRQMELDHEIRMLRETPSTSGAEPRLAERIQTEMKPAEGRNAEPSADERSPGCPDRRKFDVSKCIALVPTFRETEVDSYFAAFERLAAALDWPREVWSLILQCKLSGKALEVMASLSITDGMDYEKVKSAVLNSYELVPEAYRQKFRALKHKADQTHVEFAREKLCLFEKWLSASKAATAEEIKELILMEEMKRCLPERLVLYLNEQKVTRLADAALLADEFALTHRFSGEAPRSEHKRPAPMRPPGASLPPGRPQHCFYCHRPGHIVKDCLVLKRRNEQKRSPPREVGLLIHQPVHPVIKIKIEDESSCFEPFLSQGFVADNENGTQVPVKILRDTGASQSLILQGTLPLCETSSTGLSVLLSGLNSEPVLRPLHRVWLKCDLVQGVFDLAVCPTLPVTGVTLLLGNDVAGGAVVPPFQVRESPFEVASEVGEISDYYPACVVTRSQRKLAEDRLIDVSGLFEDEKPSLPPSPSLPLDSNDEVRRRCWGLPLTHDTLGEEQKADETLQKCFRDLENANERVTAMTSGYFVGNGILMRFWKNPAAKGAAWGTVKQIIIPVKFRSQILSLAHESQWAGHLGIRKTYLLLLEHFFWPGMKRSVREYCQTCHVCQIAGKPNQPPKPVPLTPIPVIGNAFDHVIVDCVGPLPRSKSGKRFLLTIMCTATRFPEAVPLSSITAKAVIKALTSFFSLVGLPKVLQTDQGTNFKSELFQKVATSLGIQHVTSSAYHPESQGVLERWHQTIKAMLRKYCLSSGRSWDEGLPFLLFAAREAPQASLGFSPAQLVFGHTPRGPLLALKERILQTPVSAKNKVNLYVAGFQRRLKEANCLARNALQKAQSKMKAYFDKKAEPRDFSPGDMVLILNPVAEHTLSVKFSGPFPVVRKLTDTTYLIQTPERRQKERVCHINMLKRYHTPLRSAETSSEVMVCAAISSELKPEEDIPPHLDKCVGPRLENSQVLTQLPTKLEYLEPNLKRELLSLINNHLKLFSDVPSRTHLIEHDVVTSRDKPIKQHPYRANPLKRKLMKQETDYLIRHGLATPSYSPWSSPCLVEQKPDGTPRFITDYRKLNAVTISDAYPLPRVDDCVDRVGNSKFVTKLDLLKGYWQVLLTAAAKEASAFVTPDEFLEYTVMPFGMRNAPATFQRLINTVIADLEHCHAYLDDIVVHTSTWDEHIATLKELFSRLDDANLTINLAKTEFVRATVTYLGKEVGQGSVRMLRDKILAIKEFPTPTTRRELRRFVGMVGYYRCFCKNFAVVASPLTDLLSPQVPFKWTTAAQGAFENCKLLLSTAPVLQAPDVTRPFKLEIDASDVGMGAVLLQEDAAALDHPVSYFSKKFAKYQLHYSTVEKETLALVLAIQHFEVYLYPGSTPIQVYTDHNPLVFLSRMYNKNQRLMRWALLVQDYNLQIQHKQGKDNVVADSLSRAF
uniref:Gypsy retrotransposon integrase-like protein 1 n=2 Tax=Nothobranchius korthausae TaxID=1143690 RepID=A0A1A8GVS8_9TELE